MGLFHQVPGKKPRDSHEEGLEEVQPEELEPRETYQGSTTSEDQGREGVAVSGTQPPSHHTVEGSDTLTTR